MPNEQPSLQELREMFVGNLVEVVFGEEEPATKGCADLGFEGDHLWMVFHDGSGSSIDDWRLEGRSLKGETPNQKQRSYTIVGPKYSIVIQVEGRLIARPVIEVFQRVLNTPNKAAARLRGTKTWDAGDDQFMAIRALLVSLEAAGFSGKWDDYEVILMPPEAAL